MTNSWCRIPLHVDYLFTLYYFKVENLIWFITMVMIRKVTIIKRYGCVILMISMTDPNKCETLLLDLHSQFLNYLFYTVLIMVFSSVKLFQNLCIRKGSTTTINSGKYLDQAAWKSHNIKFYVSWIKNVFTYQSWYHVYGISVCRRKTKLFFVQFAKFQCYECFWKAKNSWSQLIINTCLGNIARL